MVLLAQIAVTVVVWLVTAVVVGLALGVVISRRDRQVPRQPEIGTGTRPAPDRPVAMWGDEDGAVWVPEQRAEGSRTFLQPRMNHSSVESTGYGLRRGHWRR